MQLPITALYAGLLAVFALYLSFKAGTFRAKTGISVLHGEPANMELAGHVRRHQNFLEYVPFIVILMAVIELNGGFAWALHAIGILTIVARIAHMIGLQPDNMAHPGRAIGAGGTALITLVAAAYAIWMSFSGMT